MTTNHIPQDIKSELIEYDYKGAIKTLRDLRQDARMNKARHFPAAARKRRLNNFLGIGTIFASAGILFCARQLAVFDSSQGSGLFSSLSKEHLGVATMIFALITGVFAALQLFFKFDRAVEGHMSVANRYAGINRRCKNLIGKIEDGEIVGKKPVWNEIESITTEYLAINSSAESFHTSDKDHDRANKEDPHTPFDDYIVNTNNHHSRE